MDWGNVHILAATADSINGPRRMVIAILHCNHRTNGQYWFVCLCSVSEIFTEKDRRRSLDLHCPADRMHSRNLYGILLPSHYCHRWKYPLQCCIADVYIAVRTSWLCEFGTIHAIYG